MKLDGAKVLGVVVRDGHELLRACRERAAYLNISRETIDDHAGLTPGYASKLLAVPPTKTPGPVTLFPLLGALGYAMALVEDKARMVRVNRLPKRKCKNRSDKQWRNAKALGMILEMSQVSGSAGGRARFAGMTKKQKHAHQSRAAKARWRKWRRRRREATAAKPAAPPHAPTAVQSAAPPSTVSRRRPRSVATGGP